MQFKPIAVIIVLLLLVASLSVCGCTSSNNAATATPTAATSTVPIATPTVKPTATPTVKPTATPTSTKTPTATPTSSTDRSSYITNQFSHNSNNYIIVTPFKKSTNSYGNVVYYGVVKDNEQKLYAYTHKITIELTKNRDDTKTRYSQRQTELLNSGLIKMFDYGDYMTFYDGSTTSHPSREAYLDMNEPSWIYHIYNTGVFLYLGDTFMVTVDDTTQL